MPDDATYGITEYDTGTHAARRAEQTQVKAREIGPTKGEPQVAQDKTLALLDTGEVRKLNTSGCGLYEGEGSRVLQRKRELFFL